MATYTIRSGDTLSAIALKNGTTVAALAAANGITNPDKIKAGATITIPAAKTAAAAPQTMTLDQLKNQLLEGQAKLNALGAAPSSTSPMPQNSTPPNNGGITYEKTGVPEHDAVLEHVAGVGNNLVQNGYTIPENLKITPGLISQFLTYAHQAADPYTKQLISSALTNMNSQAAALGTQYQNSVGERQQQFGTDLATEQNAAGAHGTAFSGQRNINELNMAASANRDLSTLGANAAYNLGGLARDTAAKVGSANAASIALPSLSTGTVSLAGGQRGTSGTGGALSYNYDPSIYTVGDIPSAQTGAVNQLQQSYISQYGNLSNAQSNGGRSMKDLIGMMSGLPSGYQLPTNLT